MFHIKLLLIYKMRMNSPDEDLLFISAVFDELGEGLERPERAD